MAHNSGTLQGHLHMASVASLRLLLLSYKMLLTKLRATEAKGFQAAAEFYLTSRPINKYSTYDSKGKAHKQVIFSLHKSPHSV